MALLNSGDPKDEPHPRQSAEIHRRPAGDRHDQARDSTAASATARPAPARSASTPISTTRSSRSKRCAPSPKRAPPPNSPEQGSQLEGRDRLHQPHAKSHRHEQDPSGPATMPTNKGGFIYYPGFSNAGEVELPDGKKALRSYGTMTYARPAQLHLRRLEEGRSPRRRRARVAGEKLHARRKPRHGPRRVSITTTTSPRRASPPPAIDELTTADGKKVDWPATSRSS